LRENNYNTGLRGVLFDAEHYARMGPAVWLYGWLILRQTHQTGTIGWVLGGAPIHYREIEEETGFNRRTLERWMKMLRRQNYIETAVVESGITIRILRAKKHLHRSADKKPVRRNEGGVRNAAERVPLNCVAGDGEKYLAQQVTGGIGSSSVVRIKEKEARDIHEPVEREEKSGAEPSGTKARQWVVPEEKQRTNQNEILQGSWSGQKQNHHQRVNHDPTHMTLRSSDAPQRHPREAQFRGREPGQNESSSDVATHSRPQAQNYLPQQRESGQPSAQQNFSWELRERMRLIRAERDEAVRRELSVGSGPEVRRQ
jgi:hypothetical protein